MNDADINKVKKNVITGLKFGVPAVLGLGIIFGSFFTVDQKNADVVTRWHKFSYIAEPGLHFKIPYIDDVISYTTATQQVEVEHATTITKDNQQAYPTLLVQYNTPPNGIKIVYEHYPNIDQRIYSLSSDIMKNVFGTYQVMDIPQSRSEIEGKIFEQLKKDALALYGMDITEVQIKDIDYTDAFKIYIDNMTKAKASVEQAKQLKLQAEADAARKVIEAEGEAKSRIAQADGEAQAVEVSAKASADKTRMEGEAEADAIKAKTEALNASPQFVNYTIAKQWNGKLPDNIGVGASSASIPMINLGSIKQ